MVYAATKFDRTKYDNKFISYAVHWIRYYVNEELRNKFPVKLNQNYVYKRTRIKNFVDSYTNKYGKSPDISEISKALDMSTKVINNILSVNNGENFKFISFQAVNHDSTDDQPDEDYVEQKLVNEYLSETKHDSGLLDFELVDLLTELKNHVCKTDYNMFVDKYLNQLSYSEIAKKYHLNFPSSAKYIIERVEKKCKQLLE